MLTRRGRSVSLFATAVFVIGLVMVGGAPAVSAACHAFTVKASPSETAEGNSITVTVGRDGAVNPSRVDVSTVDGTATGGQDFEPVQRTISFTTETEQSFDLAITDDAEPEPSESFRLHLSNPGGCAINPNFALGPDATVTIAASDPVTTTEQPPPPSTTAPSTTTAPAKTTTTTTTTAVATTPGQDGSPRATTTTDTAPPTTAMTSSPSMDESTTSHTALDTTTSTFDSGDLAAGSTDDGNSVTLALLGAALVAAVVTAGGIAWVRHRRSAG